LLDEYQDTSVVQTRMLARLFAGHPVMAVGDPNQSIYGWRGASASNLDDFAAAFGAEVAVGYFALSTSWRNGTEILAAANTIVAPFASAASVRVEALTASATASSRPIDSVFAETVTAEAHAVALWLKERLSHPRPNGQPPSAAILFRARKTQRHFIAALREQSLKFHVLGIGGLMSEPEIADLVAALTVVNDPSAGLELLRLLAGSRWRIGVQDLFALNRLASWLGVRDYAQHRYEESVAQTLRASVAEGEGGSIVDALDFIGTAKPGHTALTDFSAVGLDRLKDAAHTFAKLRGRVGLDLPDFAAFVLQELQLDIEVIANESRSTGTAAIEAFYDAIDNYFALDDESTLGGFLAWLREAERREDLSPRPESPEPGTVQILTIHGAKGLEWDHVVVPRLVEDELPGTPASGGYMGWLGFGELPWQFRGDAAELPVFRWRSATSRKEVDTELADFKARVRLHLEAEERRLAYVAVTRARHSVLLSGSFWATQTKPRLPSRYLRELAEAGLISDLPESSTAEINPLGDELELITWPFDPLGGRREKVEAAADAVRTAPPALAGGSRRELELLLEERRRRLDSSGTVGLPVRVPASRFKDFVSSPSSVAADLRRPMPERPYRATQLGTLFHSWVEDRYSLGGDSDELDALPTQHDADDFVDAAKLAELTATFERSPWADRKPVEVELEIHLPFDRHIVICKIDAVYESHGRFEIVDWKTGKPPRDAQDLEEKQLQLALYRLAFAKWKGIDPQLIDAVFYFVGDDRVIRPERIFSEAELLEQWHAVFQ
jgi:DNA helicase-2/ATP-dependent DNA helicase PcrA